MSLAYLNRHGRLVLAPDEKLPEDVPTLQALLRQALAEMAHLRAENAELRGKLDAALKHRFGRRSERQLTAGDAKQNKPGRAKPHGRAALPASLERRQVGHDLTEAEKLCPCCGRTRVGQTWCKTPLVRGGFFKRDLECPLFPFISKMALCVFFESRLFFSSCLLFFPELRAAILSRFQLYLNPGKQLVFKR